jgi:hypothetical protein
MVPKLVALVERLRIGTAGVPVPLRANESGLPAALLVMVRVPVRAPVVVGEKVTATWQLEPAEMAPLQELFDWVKSPVVVMFEIVTEAVPLLVRVMVWGALERPWMTEPKAEKEVGETVNCGVVPPPPPLVVVLPEPQPLNQEESAMRQATERRRQEGRRNTGDASTGRNLRESDAVLLAAIGSSQCFQTDA